MDERNSVVEAMLVENGRISALGSNDSVNAKLPKNIPVVDLGGRTLIPGFVDAHSHFPASGIRAVSVDLSPPPIGDTTSLKTLLARLSNAAKSSNGKDWILGYNYDNTALKDGQHPTREQLDSVVSDQPVYLWHSSGHMGVANSTALAKLSIDESSKAVQGGFIGRDLKTGKLTGLLQEKSAPPLADIVTRYSMLKQLEILTTARDEYLAAGVTTVQNGYAGKNMTRVLKFAQRLGFIRQRVVIWPASDKRRISYKPNLAPNKDFQFTLGAVKILVDGSPQGFTAFLSQPYFFNKDRAANYRGFALFNQDALTKLVVDYHVAGYQLALHGNGDAAIDQIIVAVKAAQAALPRPDARHIIVHAQVLRQDQVDQLKTLSLYPSFFTSHTYYWGDWHRRTSLGPARAQNISPAQWALDAGVRFSLHSDSPVTPINPMQLIWSATTRQTQSGFTLGPDQRISALAALRALTIDAAWHNHIEGSVGSFELGKFADAVVLSQSPLEADDARKIRVLETYINGVKRYSREPVPAGD